MKTFEQWFMEQVPGTTTAMAGAGIPQPTAGQPRQPTAGQPRQPTAEQPQKGDEFIIHIPPGQEAMFSNNLIRKFQGGDYDLKNEFKTIFDTAKAYLMRSGGQRTGEINRFFKRLVTTPLQGTTVGRYLEDGNKQMAQNREWNGTMPNLLMYEPAWANRAFDDMDPESIMQAISGLAATVGQLTQGATQKSVFAQ